MFEKVNPQHPDKVADRIAGAIVDLAYSRCAGGFMDGNTRIAVEVLIGHGHATVIIETSLGRAELPAPLIEDAVVRICPIKKSSINLIIVPQDEHLSKNQEVLRCGDNGIFRGKPVTDCQKELTALAQTIYHSMPTDGKYVLTDGKLIVCQSNATHEEIKDLVDVFYTDNHKPEPNVVVINPLGEWTGGIGVDSGATNRKLGSDMGDAVTGGGLHGKDLSKADVSVNIACHILAQKSHQEVSANCAIGDESVRFRYADGTDEVMTYEKIVGMARLYLLTNYGGSFEKFAEWGLIK